MPEGNATFTLRDVTIGINFHWEQKEDETFEGGLRLLLNADGTITAITRAAPSTSGPAQNQILISSAKGSYSQTK